MSRPFVSIIVPIYNTEPYLVQCVDSLLHQTMENIEIILVDDASPDNAPGICDAYAKRDARIKVIHQTNRGLGLSRNSGLAIATGEYVGFVDSDDCVAPNMYQVLYDNAEQHHADISYCGLQRFTGEEQIVAPDVVQYPVKQWQGDGQIRQYLLDCVGQQPDCRADKLYGLSVCVGIFSRDRLEAMHARFVSEREFISEDMIFDIDVIPRCNVIVHQDAPLYYYRHNPHSLTTTYKRDRFAQNVRLCHEMHSRLTQAYTEEEIHLPLARYLLTVARIAVIQELRFVSQNGRDIALEHIKEVCETQEVRDTLQTYPYWRLPFKYGLTCCLMRHEQARLLYLLYSKYRH